MKIQRPLGDDEALPVRETLMRLKQLEGILLHMYEQALSCRITQSSEKWR